MWRRRTETALQAKKVRETSKDTDKKRKGPKKARTPAQEEATRKMIEAGKAKRFGNGREAASSGKKGGKASGKARREKRDMAEWARYFLDLPVHDGDVKTEGSSLDDFTQTNTTVRARIIKNLVSKASNGDMHAIGMLAELTGEAPIQQMHVEVHDVTKMSISELIAYRKRLQEGKE